MGEAHGRGEEAFTVTLTLRVRACTAEDLPQLEWFGLFTPHRERIAEVFAGQRRGEALILVVESQGAAVGQVWLDLQEKRAGSVGVLWALRVMPGFQGAGLGSRLVRAAEHALATRGFRTAEITTEADNPRARALYERLGYRWVGREHARHGEGTLQDVLRRDLTLPGAQAPQAG